MGGGSFGATFEPAGILSLTTDFGLDDGYVGIMHGVAYGIARGLAIVDLVHTIRAQDVLGASFHMRSAWESFPAGTVHVIVVDPGVGTTRRSLVAAVHGQLFVAPDNGILPAIFAGRHGDAVAYGVLDAENQISPSPSRTFHGRDLYAPVGARLASGQLLPQDAVTASLDPSEAIQLPGTAPSFAAGRAQGVVIHTDHFGNAITCLDARDRRLRDLLERPCSVEVAGHVIPLVGTYGDAAEGDLVALVDSFGLLEVAEVGGDAAEGLGIEPGAPVALVVRDRR